MPRIIPPGNLLDAVRPASPAQGLRVGQVLRAAVRDGTPPGRGGGHAVLELGRLVVNVRSQIPLPAGATLTVQVARLRPTLSLRLLAPLQPPAHDARPETEAARTLLPRQSGWGGAVETLAAALRHPSLPRDVARQARALLQSVPTRAKVSTAEGLRAALRDSGLFLEARLLADGAAPAGDLKAALLRLRALLPKDVGRTAGGPVPPPPPRPGAALTTQPRVPAPPPTADLLETLGGLRRLVDGALARIGLHQLGSRETGAEAEASRSWMLELPVLNEDGGYDVLQLRVHADRERRRGGGSVGRWSVELALDLPDLGPLHARIGLQGRRVTASLWLERPESAAAVEAALPELEQALRAHELEVGALHCRRGRPEPPSAPPDSGRLVETRV